MDKDHHKFLAYHLPTQTYTSNSKESGFYLFPMMLFIRYDINTVLKHSKLQGQNIYFGSQFTNKWVLEQTKPEASL